MGFIEQQQPLTDTELDRLEEVLERCDDHGAMSIEELDGFFAALIAGPEIVPPSEYLPEIFGGDWGNSGAFRDLEEANEILGLLMRHWNTIAGTLEKGDVYVPILLKDENGIFLGSDWAMGFMGGMEFFPGAVVELMDDENKGGCILPMLILLHEHDEDPKMRPEPISPEKREEIIIAMAAGLVCVYEYFRPHRQHVARSVGEPLKRPSKIGRNDPCPCRSGKKYKRCCGGATIQ